MFIYLARAKKPVMSVRRQSGVIPYRVVDGRIEILLVSSRYSGRWGIPKGGAEPEMTLRESATNEAFEEAGVVGRAHKKLGEYRYLKRTGRPQHVVVYAMRVTKILSQWDEKHERTRQWFSDKDAGALLNRNLRDMIERIRMLEKRRASK